MAILYSKPTAWANYRRALPNGFSVISDSEALKKPQILTAAREFINRQVKANAPLGTSETKTVGNDVVHFIVEPHYHDPKGKVKPHGWHKGCTVFIQKGGSMGLTPQQIARGGALMPSIMSGEEDFGEDFEDPFAGDTDFGAATEFGAHGKQTGALADGTPVYAPAPVDLLASANRNMKRAKNDVQFMLATRNRNAELRRREKSNIRG